MSAKLLIGIVLIGAVAFSACSTGLLQPTPSLYPPSILTADVATAVFTSTPTPAQTATPKPGAVWEGEWQIHVAGNENDWDGTSSIEVNGLEVTGSFDLYDPNVPGLHYTFIGDLAEGYSQVVGTWQLVNGGMGDFFWQLVPNKSYQFGGNLDTGKFAFCGWRAGSSAPSPCKWQ